MIKANYHRYLLDFKTPSGTSRGVLTQKETWFLVLEHNGCKGIGECGLFRGLSCDDTPEYQQKLAWVCKHINKGVTYLLAQLIDYPSIQFGVEQAFKSLTSLTHPLELWGSEFTKSEQSIPINGLVWMGSKDFIKAQIKEKISAGFTCIKLKIGALDFETEYQLLKDIRSEFSKEDIELRVDANGAFSADEALEKLKRLSTLDLHSIEQPIKQGQIEAMQVLCAKSPLAIALDEELIGVNTLASRTHLLSEINPQYIILKPSLIGGFSGSKEWMRLADSKNIKYWITSALESNVGLSAIAQLTYLVTDKNTPQGLGTGSLFTNNFESPLKVTEGKLWYSLENTWEIPYF